MARSKARIVFLGTLALVAVAVICILFVSSRIVERRIEFDLRILQETLEREEAKHDKVERARAGLPQDSPLARDWSLEQAMTAWNSDEIQAVAEIAKQFSKLYATPRKEDLSADDKEKITLFVMHSPELRELLEAIEHDLCEITVDPSKGQWQISNAQIRALKSMTYLLAARALLLAENGDKDAAVKTVLSSYGLMDVLVYVPNMHLQSYRADMLLYVGYALRDGLSPDEIPDDSKAALLAYLERQSSKEPIVNVLLLHEALDRREVAEKYPRFMVSWLLAGYHKGIERIVQSLDRPERDVHAECNEILYKVPFYAGQTRWRLQNVTDALYVRVNTQRHVTSVRTFLGVAQASPSCHAKSPCAEKY